MNKKIVYMAVATIVSLNLSACGAGSGKIAAKNLSSDKIDDGFYYIDNGVMQYDFATNTSAKIIANEDSSIIFKNVYSFEKYLIYQTIDETDPKSWTYTLTCADKENNFETSTLYTSSTEFWVNSEGDDLYVMTGDETYISPNALKDISLLNEEASDNSDSIASDGSDGTFTCANGTEVDFKITDHGTLTYDISGTTYTVDGLDEKYMDSVEITENRMCEADNSLVLLLTFSSITGHRNTYNQITNSDFKEDVLVKIDMQDYTSNVIYTSTSAKERIVGYDGSIYLYKNGKLLKTSDGKNFDELSSVKLDSEEDYEFTWVGNNLVIFDVTNNEVISCLSK